MSVSYGSVSCFSWFPTSGKLPPVRLFAASSRYCCIVVHKGCSQSVYNKSHISENLAPERLRVQSSNPESQGKLIHEIVKMYLKAPRHLSWS